MTTGRTTNFLILLAAVYSAAGLFLLPFLSLTHGQDEATEEEQAAIDLSRIADYDIQVTLNATNHTLSGQETITWVNAGGAPTNELYFHLYMNAFRSPDTRFFDQGGGWSEDAAGWISVNSLQLADGTNLLPLSIVDETVMRVKLPRTVAPGERLSISVEFEVQLPKIIARTGYSDRYHLVAQWFPKLGVYMDGRWICPQFHRFGEFFANFGMYRVEITVPKSYEVEATGIRQRARTGTTTKTLIYSASPVHDFAWTASPFFRKSKRDLTYQTPEGPKTLEVHLMLQRDRQHVAERYFTALGQSLQWFTELMGDYPYPVIKVIDPAPGRGMNSAGMEYPMFIVGGSSWLDETLLQGNKQLTQVTVHEFAHQYFQSAIASNEFQSAWMDEGLTTYAENKIGRGFGNLTHQRDFLPVLYTEFMTLNPFVWGMEYSFDDFAGLLQLGHELNWLNYLRDGYLPVRSVDPVAIPANSFFNALTYYSAAYFKPALMLHTLEGMIGRQTLREFLRQYYQRYKFRHPSAEEFRAGLSEVAGEDLEWFLGQVLDSARVLDYGVRDYDTNRVIFERFGEMVVPQTIRLTLSSGDTVHFNWPLTTGVDGRLWMEEFLEHQQISGLEYRLQEGGDKSWFSVELKGSFSIESAQIDPEYIYKLDSNFANNSVVLIPANEFADRMSLKWVRVISRWLHGLSAYN